MLRPLVLLAEDDTDLRELISGRLTREGMKVVEVEDGFELRDYLSLCHPGGRVPRPDVIVSDVNMPGESGPYALEVSNRDRAPVVLITGEANREMRDDAARAGVAEIFEKPFALAELVLTIRRLTEGVME